MATKLTPPNLSPKSEADVRSGYASSLGIVSKIAVVTSVTAALMALALVFMFPLKREVPYTVQINKTTGNVYVPPNQVSHRFSPGWINESFFLRRWLVDLFTINRYLTVQLYDPRAQSFLRGRNAISEYKAFRQEDQTFLRLAKDPTLVREVKVENLTQIAGTKNGAVASITLKTISNGHTMRQRLLVTLYFVLIPSSNHVQVVKNPIGIYITDFQISNK